MIGSPTLSPCSDLLPLSLRLRIDEMAKVPLSTAIDAGQAVGT